MILKLFVSKYGKYNQKTIVGTREGTLQLYEVADKSTILIREASIGVRRNLWVK